jgi:hypothetical protein
VAIYGNFINRVVVLTNILWWYSSSTKWIFWSWRNLNRIKSLPRNFKLCRTLPF